MVRLVGAGHSAKGDNYQCYCFEKEDLKIESADGTRLQGQDQPNFYKIRGDQMYDEQYTNYQTNRGLLKSFVRSYYVRKAATMTTGRVLDFGCGVGDLLKLLGNGSVGLECNSSTIKHLEVKGLHAIEYDGFSDDWNLGVIPEVEVFDTMVMSHFLEHFERPFEILNKVILSSCRLGVTRFVIIVPGESGFKLDKTHRYFIKKLELLNFLKSRDDIKIVYVKLFPFNFDFISRFFPHNELQVVFEIS